MKAHLTAYLCLKSACSLLALVASPAVTTPHISICLKLVNWLHLFSQDVFQRGKSLTEQCIGQGRC